MASTWGLSWGTSWGTSWDRTFVPPPAQVGRWQDGGYHTREDWEKHQIQLRHPWEKPQLGPGPTTPIVVELPAKVREEDEVNEIVRMLSWLDDNGYLDDDDD